MPRSEHGDIFCLLDDALPHGRGLLVRLKLYFDRGAKRVKDDSVMTVAAIIFSPDEYRAFVKPWNRMLKAWGAEAFHATDFYTGYDEFRRNTPAREDLFQRDSRLIPRLIAPRMTKAIAVAFRPDEAMPLLSDEWKLRFGESLHSIAVQLALVVLGWWAKEINYTGGFACVAEGGDDDSDAIEATVKLMAKDPVTGPHIQVASYLTVLKDGQVRGVEAADFLAWHWNHHYLHRTREGKDSEPRKDFYAFAALSGDKLGEIFLTGDKLRHFLRLGENFIRENTFA